MHALNVLASKWFGSSGHLSSGTRFSGTGSLDPGNGILGMGQEYTTDNET